jgi:hypothetical protein
MPQRRIPLAVPALALGVLGLLACLTLHEVIVSAQLRGWIGGIPLREMRVGRELSYDPRWTLWTYQLLSAVPTEAPYTIEFHNDLDLCGEGCRVTVRCRERERECFLPPEGASYRDNSAPAGLLFLLVLECTAGAGLGFVVARREWQ